MQACSGQREFQQAGGRTKSQVIHWQNRANDSARGKHVTVDQYRSVARKASADPSNRDSGTVG
jgi:hypothetical protein